MPSVANQILSWLGFEIKKGRERSLQPETTELRISQLKDLLRANQTQKLERARGYGLLEETFLEGKQTEEARKLPFTSIFLITGEYR